MLSLLLGLNARAGDSVLVYFAFDKYHLDVEAKSKLDELVREAMADEGTIKIFGHTDQIGSAGYNNVLSVKRAEAVRDYLLGQAIDRQSIIMVKGKGKSELLRQELEEDARQQNRRVLVVHESGENKPAKPNASETPPKNSLPEPKPKLVSSLAEKMEKNEIKIGERLVLRHINFVGGRSLLLESAQPALQELLQVMKQHPKLKIVIEGHICCIYGPGDGIDLATLTPDLSVRRAIAVFDFLVSNGIDPSRMNYRGFGHSKPLTEERDAEEAAMNRRVEIRILEK